MSFIRTTSLRNDYNRTSCSRIFNLPRTIETRIRILAPFSGLLDSLDQNNSILEQNGTGFLLEFLLGITRPFFFQSECVRACQCYNIIRILWLLYIIFAIELTIKHFIHKEKRIMGCISTTEARATKKPKSLEALPETIQTHPDGSKSRTLPVIGSEGIMSKKCHGTSITPVQDNLRWGCDFKTADRICNYNRHYGRFCY